MVAKKFKMPVDQKTQKYKTYILDLKWAELTTGLTGLYSVYVTGVCCISTSPVSIGFE